MTDEWAAQDCAHPDCDGWRMHCVYGFQDRESGTWTPRCPICGPLPVIGSASTAAGARAMVSHDYSARCEGECAKWFEEAA